LLEVPLFCSSYFCFFSFKYNGDSKKQHPRTIPRNGNKGRGVSSTYTWTCTGERNTFHLRTGSKKSSISKSTSKMATITKCIQSHCTHLHCRRRLFTHF
jgi:hypothetical protein